MNYLPIQVYTGTSLKFCYICLGLRQTIRQLNSTCVSGYEQSLSSSSGTSNSVEEAQIHKNSVTHENETRSCARTTRTRSTSPFPCKLSSNQGPPHAGRRPICRSNSPHRHARSREFNTAGAPLSAIRAGRREMRLDRSRHDSNLSWFFRVVQVQAGSLRCRIRAMSPSSSPHPSEGRTRLDTILRL